MVRTANELGGPQVRLADRRLQPLVSHQPKGPSFAIRGQEVAWLDWRLRWSFDPMHGLSLYRIRRADQGLERDVAYHLGLAEMAVP